MIGTVIAEKYEIVRELGKGGMGEVYEAKHVGTGRRAALKLIRGILATDDGILARFQREARAAGAIESPHITQVFDTGKDPESGSPFIVMELLSGEDLDTLLGRLGPMPPTLALRIVAQALAGLARAHAANVIHRDIKPANLFIAKAGETKRVVKLVDFGIAKVKDDLVHSREAVLTQTSTLLGSPMYMSPEQAKSSKHVDARADIWSLGIVLWQLLVGVTPFAHTESLTELLLALCTEPVKPVQEKAPWVPADIADIAGKALMSDPAERWASAQEMLAAIAKIVPDWETLDDGMLVPMSAKERAVVATTSERSVSAKTMLVQTPAPTSKHDQAAASATSSALSTTHPQPAPRSRLALGVAAGAMLVGIVGGTFLVMNGGQHGRDATPNVTGLVAPPPPAASSVVAAEPSAVASSLVAPPPSAVVSVATPRASAPPKPHASTPAAAASTTPALTATTKPKPPPAPTSSSPISREFN